MSGAMRTSAGGRIDRSRAIRFTFDGKSYQGHPGDTLSSALLANGVRLMGRSFKYHRPRGPIAAGSEEPNALVEIHRDAGRMDTNTRATVAELYDGMRATSQNRFPSLSFDAQAINDVLSPLFSAGFYYKTFMWPASAWRFYEERIRAVAGLGAPPTEPDPDRYLHRHAHCDVLVAGSGPAGLAAALNAARAGARVILCDEQAELGGSTLAERADRRDLAAWREGMIQAMLAAPGHVTLLPRTTCFGFYDHNYLGLAERITDHEARPNPDLPRQRLWRVRAKEVVLATGAIERPLVFKGNDRPGVMLLDAARTYALRYGVLVGKKPLIFTNNDGAYEAARDLRRAGCAIAAIVDLRQNPGPIAEEARAEGIDVRTGSAIAGTEGRLGVTQAFVGKIGADGGVGLALPAAIACDAVLMSGGFNPNVALFSQSRGKLVFDDQIAAFRPGDSVQRERSCGAANGDFGLMKAIATGADAGREAAGAAGFACDDLSVDPPRGVADDAPYRLEPVWLCPTMGPRDKGKAFVDFQNDVTAKDLGLALTEGFRSIEHVKRYTTTGMGTDQGRTSNVNALAIVASELGEAIPSVGTTTFRPPYTPTTFGALVGQSAGDLFDITRRTAMHEWHVQRGAVFEDVGEWKRPRYYPSNPNEKMWDAVARECKAVRSAVGVLDASTLGKIDIQGPDAATLLNMVYTNAWSKLAVGACRYGLMLGENGMVFDDGVTSRIAENRYLMTTTSGGAARVLAWLEEWLQTEWPHLRVYCTSVTEQWATMSVSGPKSRDLLKTLVEGVDLDDPAFKHMTWRDARFAGVPARIYRISFSGELAYEVNVPAGYGLHAWRALFEKGDGFGLLPYGTEAMHVLRAEKGYVIVGQETDGTVTPHDLGMDWIVSKKKTDFIGKRSLTRPDMLKPDRKQLVGLLTKDGSTMVDEGAQVIEKGVDLEAKPVPMLGHVTSSYPSDAVGRPIAMALVRGGHGRMGETLWVSNLDGPPIEVEVTGTVFHDKDGEKLRG